MDRLRTLLLARGNIVVLDPDRVASAATRPSRDSDLDRFEDELAQLGFVMSLDLAITVRRLPHQALHHLKTWMLATLTESLGAHRPHVPLFRGFPAGTPSDTRALYLRRVLSWMFTRPDQPCPWCGQIKPVGALDPCGHLVCRSCWDAGSYAGCPICHRRVAMEPFVEPAAEAESERVTRGDTQLRLVHLAFDAIAVARDRFERLTARTTPLSKDDRTEVETVIDVIGPKAAIWLPSSIAMKETMAIAVARLWLAAPDRHAMVKATEGHLRTATDVLRVAVVLMGGDPALVEPTKLTSLSRGLRRAVLEALDRLADRASIAQIVEDVRRHRAKWKRIGERLHPFELATQLPRAALAFAVARESTPTELTFASKLQSVANDAGNVSLDGKRLRVAAWAGPVEDALRRGDVRAATARLAKRPGDLLRRADHLLRLTADDEPSLHAVIDAIRDAIPHAMPNMLLTLGAHVRARTAPWPRRVMFPKGEVLRAWAMPDTRPPLRTDAIGSVTDAVREELLARAAKKKLFARAVIDRGLVDLPVPIGERSASRTRLAWPRGTALAIPAGDMLRLFLHWEEPPHERVDLDLSVAFFDGDWRHVATCDYTNLVVPEGSEGEARAAVHSGDLTSAPPPLGASEFLDLHLDRLATLGARHAVMVVFSYNAVPFDRLTHGFAGLMVSPTGDAPFDPRAVHQRFDLSGRSQITIPLTIDLETRRLRWLDVHLREHGDVHHVGGYRAALAHIGRDFEDAFETGARPTMWDVAAIHAAARANTIYVREPGGTVSTIRRRDGESLLARLVRIYDNPDADSQLPKIPTADAPTWVALVTGDLPLPRGSAGYILDHRSNTAAKVHRLEAADLIAELVP